MIPNSYRTVRLLYQQTALGLLAFQSAKATLVFLCTRRTTTPRLTFAVPALYSLIVIHVGYSFTTFTRCRPIHQVERLEFQNYGLLSFHRFSIHKRNLFLSNHTLQLSHICDAGEHASLSTTYNIFISVRSTLMFLRSESDRHFSFGLISII